MASNILIKRSTGSTAPGSITFGELAITTGANGSVLVYDSAATRFVATNVLNDITINGGSF